MNSPNSALVSPLVILAGPLRSGTTLTKLMLDRHSRVIAPGEFDFLFDAMQTDGGRAAAEKLPAEQFMDFLSDNRVYLAGQPRVEESGSTIDRVRAYVGRYADPGKTLVLTLHRNFVTAHELFPEARFIHLMRDPRDCAKSSVVIGFAENVYHGLGPWLDAELSWDRLAPRLSAGQFMSIKFEELVARPSDELTRIGEFLGVAFEPQMLDLSATTYAAPSPRAAKQWQGNMSDSDVALVEARVGDMMQARGYARASKGKAGLGKARICLLSLHDAFFRWVRRLRFYGPGLALQDFMSRHLGMRSWSRSVRLKMNVLDNKSLK